MKSDKDRMALYLYNVIKDDIKLGMSWDVSVGDGLDFVTVYKQGKRLMRYGFEKSGNLVIRTAYNGA